MLRRFIRANFGRICQYHEYIDNSGCHWNDSGASTISHVSTH